jgi:Uma2 family endonuclease
MKAAQGGNVMAVTRPNKPAGTWTYEDLFSLPDDGRRYEIIEGELIEMPSPTWEHSTIVMNLLSLLLPVVQGLGGLLRTAPLDTFFPGADPVQPDVLVILPGLSAHGHGRGVEGPPDLVIEVLSPSHRAHDLLVKRSLDARGGVREYWIVDLAHRTVEVLTLDRDAFHTQQRAAEGDAFSSPLLGDASFSAAAVFADLDESEDEPS